MQLLPSLLCGLNAACATFPDLRKGRGGNIAITDFGLAAFSMFFMQSSSFLAFQRALEKGQGRSNGQTLFGIGRIPSDNYIRVALDGLGSKVEVPMDWLRSLGFSRYEAAFRDSSIDVDVLSDLTDGDLEKLGVTLGDRKRLLKERPNANAPIAPSPGRAPPNSTNA